MKKIKYKMVFVGVLPYSYDENNNLVFLLGREAYVEGWSDSLQWSGFGGSLEVIDRSIQEGIAREAYEESMGFLGTKETIYDKIISNSIYVTGKNIKPRRVPSDILMRDINDDGYTSLLYITYDPTLPNQYLRVYDYIRSSTIFKDNFPQAFSFVGKKTGYYEKIEIDWFTQNEILENIDYKFRSVFVHTLNQILKG